MPTDPAVEALADVLWRHEVSTGQADAALDHIAAHLHDDTPEGERLRERLGLTAEWTVRHSQGIHPGPFTEASARAWLAESIGRDETRRPEQRGKNALLVRATSPWRDA